MTDSQWEKYAVRTPDTDLFAGVKGRNPIMTYMNDKLVPGAPYHIDVSFITEKPDPHIFSHTMDYDRIIIHWGLDYETPQDLGAKIEYNIGGQRIEFHTTTSMFIPAGTPVGPVNWLEFNRPHIMMNFILGTGDSSVITNSGMYVPNTDIPKKTDKFDYEQYVIRSPMRQAGHPDHAPHRQHPTMTYMSRDQITIANYYIEFGWIWSPVKPPLPQMRHDKWDEIVLHVGCDPDNPTDLGADMKFGMEEDKLEFDTAYCMWLPKGFTHGPLTWSEVRKPHIEMAIMIGAGTVEEGWEGSFFEMPPESEW